MNVIGGVTIVTAYLASAIFCWLRVRYECKDTPDEVETWMVWAVIVPIMNTMVAAILIFWILERLFASKRFARRFFWI